MRFHSKFPLTPSEHKHIRKGLRRGWTCFATPRKVYLATYRDDGTAEVSIATRQPRRHDLDFVQRSPVIVTPDPVLPTLPDTLPPEHSLQVGDILIASTGFQLPYYLFFQIAALSGKQFIYLRKLCTQIDQNRRTVSPILKDFRGKRLRRQVHTTEPVPFVRIHRDLKAVAWHRSPLPIPQFFRSVEP